MPCLGGTSFWSIYNAVLFFGAQSNRFHIFKVLPQIYGICWVTSCHHIDILACEGELVNLFWWSLNVIFLLIFFSSSSS